MHEIVPHSQRNCIEFALNAKPVRRYIPKNPIQYKLWAFATSPACEYTVFAAIMLNTLSLAMKYYQQPKVKTHYLTLTANYKNLCFQLYTTFLDSLNIIFTVFFTLEFVLKFGAFRFKVGAVISYCKSFSLVHLNIESKTPTQFTLYILIISVNDALISDVADVFNIMNLLL